MRFSQTEALTALTRYNRPEVAEIDRRAKRILGSGIGSDPSCLVRQLCFLFNDYGAWTRSGNVPSSSVWAIANEIERNRADLEIALRGTGNFSAYANGTRSLEPFRPLLDGFRQLDQGCTRLEYTAFSKYLHHLKPEAFPTHGNWVGAALGHPVGPGADLCELQAFIKTLDEFAQAHASILPALEAADQGQSWSRLKLFDKILLCRSAAGISKSGKRDAA